MNDNVKGPPSTEDELKKLKSSFLVSQRISKTGTWKQNLETNELYWSDEFYNICGLPPQSVIATVENFKNIIHEDDLGELKVIFHDAIDNKYLNVLAEYRIVRPCGEIRFVNIQGEVIYNEDNIAISMHGILQDVTEQVLKEQEAQKLQQRLIEAQRIAKVGSWNYDIVNDKLYWSDEIFRIIGLEVGSINPVYDDFISVLHPDDREAVEAAVANALENNELYYIEHRILLPDGEVKHIIAQGEVTIAKDETLLSIDGTMQDITDRKKIELKSQQREKKLHDIQSIANLGYWFMDLKKRTLDVSDEIYKIFDRDPKTTDFTIELLDSHLHPDDVKKITTASDKAKVGNGLFELEHRIILKSGEIKHLRVHGKVYFDQDGNPESIDSTMLDITTQKLTETELKTSQDILLEAQRIGRLGNWIWNLKDDSFYWSEQVFDIYGYDKKLVSPSFRAFRDILHPEDAVALNAAHNRTIEYKVPFYAEHRIILQSGEIRNCVQRAELVLDDNGEAHLLHGTVQNITELKQAEEVAKKAETSLFEIFNIAPAVIITTDQNLNITFYNNTAEKTFGYNKKETLGKNINMLIPDTYRKGHDKKVQEFDETGAQARFMSERSSIYGLKKSGEEFPVTASISTLGEGVNKSYTVILLDATEQKKIEKERVLALSEAQDANRAKSQFLATMSHELRTPLNAIIGFSEMMANKVFGDMGSPKYNEYANDIVGSSRHLLNLVNDILDLSEIEAGKTELEIKHLSLRDTIDECQFIISKLAEDKNITCKFNIPDDLTLIYADQRALKQIIINIMTNAVKFTDNNGKVILTASAYEDKHILTIEDNGIGIPKNKISTILNPFTRVENDPYKTHEGKGLGLAIVESLMSLHNGSIKIESEYGEGTKVTLIFPNKVVA